MGAKGYHLQTCFGVPLELAAFCVALTANQILESPKSEKRTQRNYHTIMRRSFTHAFFSSSLEAYSTQSTESTTMPNP